MAGRKLDKAEKLSWAAPLPLTSKQDFISMSLALAPKGGGVGATKEIDASDQNKNGTYKTSSYTTKYDSSDSIFLRLFCIPVVLL